MSPRDSIALARSDTVVVLVDTFPEETDEVDLSVEAENGSGRIPDFPETLGIRWSFHALPETFYLLASLLGAGRFGYITSSL